MTMLVVFGEEQWFGVKHGDSVKGGGDDVLYFACDERYEGAVANQRLPKRSAESTLPMMQHNGGVRHHESQKNWLEDQGYKPVCVKSFSHGDETSQIIKQFLARDATPNEDRVSNFVRQYSKRAILKHMDQLAAWITLYALAPEAKYKTVIAELRGLVNPHIENALRNDNEAQWAAILEKTAANFC